mmetsp:Transcript_46839/g.53166  ORF Transcript_46839/g.53166 Transcript_46839/m.53166 type:complete len:202 (+) Transcript_46839:237-842(+)
MKLSTICFVFTILLLDSGFVLGKELKNECEAFGFSWELPNMTTKTKCKQHNYCKVKGKKEKEKCVNFVKKECGDITNPNEKNCEKHGCEFKKNKCKDKFQSVTRVVTISTYYGAIKFEPETITINTGATVTWIALQTGHNVVFEDEDVPTGVDAALISYSGFDKLGDTYVVKFDVPGVYEYYCAPHKNEDGVGMRGKIIVE